MATKRKRLPRYRIGRDMPEWAVRLVELREEPPMNSQDDIAYFGWLFCDEPVVGLPPSESDEGWAIRHRVKSKRRSAA
jgi:hypothetical protein